MEIVAQTALISINTTVWVQLVSFLIFLVLINRLLIRPLKGTVAEREQHLDKIREEIAAVDRDLLALNEQMRASETDAKTEARQLHDRLLDEGQHEADEIFNAARREINELKQETEGQIHTQLEAARRNLAQEASRLSQTMMEQLLERRLTS